MRTVKTLTLLCLLALLATYSSAKPVVNEFRGKHHRCDREKCRKCEIPGNSYVLANPLSQESRFSATLFVEGPSIFLVLDR